jgi:hypothetical protein
MAPLLVRPAELATAPATAAVMPGQPESDSIADFLASAAERVSGLVIEGEPGIGKTTLWLAAIEQAASRGFRVESAPAGSAEVVLTFAVLADLFGDVESVVLDELPHVPAAGNPAAGKSAGAPAARESAGDSIAVLDRWAPDSTDH